jgi:UDP-N-acetyl-D-mannosaminuronic acid dehydrogenase
VNFAGSKPTASRPAQLNVADLTVVGGGGHVGIPLVLAFADAGYRVNVHDTNREVLETLRAGRLPFIEYGGEEPLIRALKQDRLVFTSAPEEISPNAPVIITIGTPIDEFLNPVRQVVQDCIDALLTYLADGQLLVLRSTVFPGTTEWLDGYLRRNDRDLKVAFCPERVVQGHGIRELRRRRRSCSAPSRPSWCGWRRAKRNSPSSSTTPIATSSLPPRTSSI